MEIADSNPFLTRKSTPLQASIRSAEIDPSGDRLHLVVAMIFMALLPLATAPRDIAMGVLVGVTVVRAFRIGSTYRSVIGIATTWAIIAYLVWMAIGLFWTSDVGSGLVDIKKHRMLLVPLLLLPVLHHSRMLIQSFLTGVLVVNVLQMLEWLQWPDGMFEPVLRYGAFNNPIVTSLFTSVAICYWFQMILHGSRRICFLSFPPLFMALLGMVLGLSRGPILGLIVALPAMTVTMYLLLPRVRNRLGAMVGLLLLTLLLVIAISPSMFTTAIDRCMVAFDEFKQADENPQSSIGIRIQMLDYGMDVVKQHPLLGTGPGAASRYIPEGIDLHGKRGDRVHLHNTYLLAAVTLGLPGLLLLLWVLLACFRQAMPLVGGASLVGGTLFALTAWMVAAVGDSYQASGNYLGVLGLLLTFSMLGAGRNRDSGALEEHSGKIA